ncbi:MAG TPA: hypothetical protein VIH40_11750 [Xanthobacteraceae bacterium]
MKSDSPGTLGALLGIHACIAAIFDEFIAAHPPRQRAAIRQRIIDCALRTIAAADIAGADTATLNAVRTYAEQIVRAGFIKRDGIQ